MIHPVHVPGVRLTANVAYASVATRLFGSGIVGAGKVMGLAPFGGVSPGEPVDYNRMTTIEELYALAAREPVILYEKSRPLNATLAFHVQRGLEIQLTESLQALFRMSARLGTEPSLCLSGGTALNSAANQVAFAASGFERLHLYPACGDDGTAVGAALWYWHHVTGRPRRAFCNRELMYSVRTYEDRIDQSLAAQGDRLNVERVDDYLDRAAELIAQGKIIGWFQGASEVGPRALGNRSILADPRRSEMKDALNSRVKFREGFRPFAPSVLKERGQEWFGLEDSPFMLRVAPVLKRGIPAVTHVDGTARVQTVDQRDNPAFYDLIERFEAKTGVPLILNTSFNIRGEPIVETPEHAINALLESDLDHLVFQRRIVRRADSVWPSVAAA